MFFLEVGKIEGFWRELLLALCKPVYQLIVYLYELFEVIATAEIITSDTLSTIYNRVGLLLGMYMMFRIIFSFIQMLINPDYITDKEKGIGNIAKKAILVVVLLGITPFVFNKAIELQNYIVGVETKDNVIAKLIFPKQIIGSEKFGAVLSASLFDSFYRYDDNYDPNKAEGDDECYIKPYGEADGGTLYSHIVNTGGNINAAKACLDNTWNPGGSEIRYSISFTQNGLFALVVGLVVCYMLLNYTLMVGARVVQLAFLRLVAPMAILGYLSPKKDGMFEKWLKMCVTTYVDLFIRMAILFFIVFMIDAIIGGDNGIALAKPFDHMWMVNIVMILALLIFGKKAPELLKELFPSTGGAASLGYGLKSPKKMFDSMLGGSILSKGYDKAIGYTKRGAKAATAGSLLGLGTAGVSAISRFKANRHNGKSVGKSLLGAAGGAAGGFYRGVKIGSAKGSVFTNASKGFKEQRTSDDKYDQLITSGGSTIGKVRSTLTSFIGETRGQTYTRQLNNMDTLAGFKKDIQSFADEVSCVKSAKDAWINMTQRRGESVEAFQARKDAAGARYRAYRNAVIDAALDGNARDANGNILVTGSYVDEFGKNQLINVTVDDRDDKNQALSIVAKRKEANSFVKSHQVEVWDESANSYRRLTEIEDRKALGDAVDDANATKTHIYSESDYNSAIANDKAAGVDSGATKNK